MNKASAAHHLLFHSVRHWISRKHEFFKARFRMKLLPTMWVKFGVNRKPGVRSGGNIMEHPSPGHGKWRMKPIWISGDIRCIWFLSGLQVAHIISSYYMFLFFFVQYMGCVGCILYPECISTLRRQTWHSDLWYISMRKIERTEDTRLCLKIPIDVQNVSMFIGVFPYIYICIYYIPCVF